MRRADTTLSPTGSHSSTPTDRPVVTHAPWVRSSQQNLPGAPHPTPTPWNPQTVVLQKCKLTVEIGSHWKAGHDPTVYFYFTLRGGGVAIHNKMGTCCCRSAAFSAASWNRCVRNPVVISSILTGDVVVFRFQRIIEGDTVRV